MRRAAIDTRGSLLAICLLAGCPERQQASQAGTSPDARGSTVEPGESRCATKSIDLVPPLDPERLQPKPIARSVKERGREIVARWYDAKIHAQPDPQSTVIGYARRGQRVRVRGGVRGTGCPADMWYALVDGGYACAAREFREATVDVPHPVRPRLDRSLPFGYARVTLEGAPSFEELPSADSLPSILSALASGERPPSGTPLQGAHFITSVELLEHEGHRFHRTDVGHFVLDQHVSALEPSRLHGEPLSTPEQLPLGLVRTRDAVVRCDCDEAIEPCGRAQPFARFGIAGRRMLPEGEHVVTTEGHLVAVEDVGIAALRSPPAKVGADERWIHVSLAQQTLVAYEGTRPVHATLVSTGKGKHATPPGLWRVDRMYVSTTMSGPDEDKGSYTVAQVPWTMFYDGDFALHGAYWHEDFGHVRSHGCTNIPPADARWLFAWSGPLPSGWHAASHLQGPWVFITED